MTDHPTIDDYRNRLERAEAECKELRAEQPVKWSMGWAWVFMVLAVLAAIQGNSAAGSTYVILATIHLAANQIIKAINAKRNGS